MSITEYALSDAQKEVAELLNEGYTVKQIAEKRGVSNKGVYRMIKVMKTRKSLRDRKEHINEVPSGFGIKGTSNLYDGEGNLKMSWVKTSLGKEEMLEMMEEAIQSLCEDVPRLEPVSLQPKTVFDPNLMAVYPLGDPHIGMMAWGEECGMDWDLKIAEKAFRTVFDRLVRVAPHCEEGVILNLGDFFHADNMAGVTSRSNHKLDVDGRYAKMVSVGMKIIRQMIHAALEVHKRVRVINVIGNHDDVSSMFLSIALKNIYENDPRVIIDSSPTPFHYVRWGKVMFGTHHGHSCKKSKLPGVMATDMAKDWGETLYRYWYTGHIHHDTLEEFPGVIVESFRTLAPKDAYAAWHGYRAGQDSKAIILHKEFGEIERHKVNLDVVIKEIMG